MIKLNGKVYLSIPAIICIIDECIKSIKTASYYEISSNIGDIPTRVKTLAYDQLLGFRNKFLVKFKKEKYLSVVDVQDFVEEAKHDSRRLKVGKYQQGAFGMRLPADEDACARWVFNICITVIYKRIKENM